MARTGSHFGGVRTGNNSAAVPAVVWGSLSVLVIDDSAATRHVIRNMLHELGVTQIFEAENGRAALKFTDIPDEQPDIVLCDWNMPNMSGIELLQQLRGAMSEQTFLMMTARRDADSVLEAKATGVNGYIVKPFSSEDLKNKMTSVLLHRQEKV